MAFIRSRTGQPRYKRAGFEFSGGWSEIDFDKLDKDKREILEKDPHLEIKAALTAPTAIQIDLPATAEAPKPAAAEQKAEDAKPEADEKKPAKSPPKPAAPPK